MHRELGSMERYVWTRGQRSPLNFALVATLRGRVDAKALAPALLGAVRRHPLLYARVDESGPVPRFVNQGLDGFPVAWRQGPGLSAMDLVAGELARPFDRPAAPLARLVLLRQPFSVELCLILHHCVADGLSAVLALGEILRALGDPGAAGAATRVHPSAETAIEGALPPEAYEGLEPPESLALLDDSPEARPASGLALATLRLGPAAFERLHARCRAAGLTLHSALCLAFDRAFRAETGKAAGGRSRIATPVNLRGRFPGLDPEAFGLYALHRELDADHEPPFWAGARSLAASLALESDPALLAEQLRSFQAVYESFLVERSPEELGARQFDYDCSVTNLGALDLKTNYGRLRLDSVWGPFVIDTDCAEHGEQVFGVCGFSGSLHLSLVSGDLPPELCRRILARAASTLDEAARN